MFSNHRNFTKPDKEMENRINLILQEMTLEEKVHMIGGVKDTEKEGGNTNPCKRLGIPSLRMADASVGIHWWIDDTTTYPASIALAASFDTNLAGEYATAIARDCRAAGVHILLGPGVNIYRSPLCGRNFEYFGEDPFLASKISNAYIKGIQDMGISATLKHYAVNYQEFDRNKVSSDLDDRTLREVYLATFEAGVKEAGVGAIMTGYNLVNGLYCAENGYLINDILKEEWNFDGIVMSDWVSVYSSLNTAIAGLDLEMPYAKWMNKENLIPAVNSGRLSERVIDDKVGRLLRLAMAFGWFENEQKEDIDNRNEINANTALKIARESVVLLKNNGVLPLNHKEIKNIAIIGPSSDPAVICGGGSGYNEGWRTISILDGMKSLESEFDYKITHAKGIDSSIAEESYKNSKFFIDKSINGVEVEYYANNDLEGYPRLCRIENSINNIWKDKEICTGIDKKNFSIRYKSNFHKEIKGQTDFFLHIWDGAVRLFIDGINIFDTWDKEDFGDHWVPVKLDSGYHEIIYEFRNIRNWNSCCLGWDNTGRKANEYSKAIELTKKSDIVVFCGGFDFKSEAEGADRTFNMPVNTENLLLDVLDSNSNVVLVLTAGGNIDMNRWHDRTCAILHAWYPGQEGGTAIAEIINGKINPSGRLPVTFEKNLEDRSSSTCYHDINNEFRVELKDGIFGGYRHFDCNKELKPRYPFGYGLSYTKFSYHNLVISETTILSNKSINIRFEIKNDGDIAGHEVPQLYLGDDTSCVPRPIKELKSFTKCLLQPNEVTTVSFKLLPKDFSWYNVEKKCWSIEAGSFTVFIGSSSENIRLKGSFFISDDLDIN